MPPQCPDHHIVAIPTAAVLFKTVEKIRLVPVTNDHAAVTEIIHKQVAPNERMQQGAAGKTRRAVHMHQLTRSSGSIRLSIEVRVMVEVTTNTGVTATPRALAFVRLELPSDHKIPHMRPELRHGVIPRVTQAAMPNIQRSSRSGFGGAGWGNHSRGHKSYRLDRNNNCCASETEQPRRGIIHQRHSEGGRAKSRDNKLQHT